MLQLVHRPTPAKQRERDAMSSYIYRTSAEMSSLSSSLLLFDAGSPAPFPVSLGFFPAFITVKLEQPSPSLARHTPPKGEGLVKRY